MRFFHRTGTVENSVVLMGCSIDQQPASPISAGDPFSNSFPPELTVHPKIETTFSGALH